MRYFARSLAGLLAAFILAAPLAAFQGPSAAPIAYPVTERQDVVETQFGVRLVDPYRWLENDVRQDPRVRAWVTAENAATNAYLDTLPGRELFRGQLRKLFDRERYELPKMKARQIFFARYDGLRNQPSLYVRPASGGAERLLVDPNNWSKDGSIALADWVPSGDGRHLAYAVQDSGSDWRSLKVLDVADGSVLADEIKWVKFSNIDWAKDGSGFFYSRFPEPKAGRQFQDLNENHSVYFHKLGAPQSTDSLVFAEPNRPKLSNSAEVSDDGRWLIVTASEGTDARYDVSLVDLTKPGSKPLRFITGLENDWRYLGNRGDTFYWVTDRGAPRLRIVATDIRRPVAELRQLVGEDAATLDHAVMAGNRIIAAYLVDATSEVRLFTLDGKPAGTVPLPGLGNVAELGGEAGDPQAFLSFTSYNIPASIYRYDSATGRTEAFAESRFAFRPEDFAVERRFYRSKDGTRVPLILMHRKDRPLDRPAPLLLHGYGGFNVSKPPEFSEAYLAWVQQGGVLAVANLRGGGEYGKAWHDAGRLANKQNSFDDFIAAAEYLIGERITTKDQLAIYGRSNGGLLIGAVVNQRPDLFAAALPQVGVMDMLRFDRFTAGRYWVDDYGYPSKEADFRTLYAYSPYQNIRGGRSYPAILATTGDTDDRVVPGHSFKYVAALQAADTGNRPKLVRIDTSTGHKDGKPTEKLIEEWADQLAFIARWTGLEVAPTR